MLVTYGEPESRLPHLTSPGLGWAVRAYVLRKPAQPPPALVAAAAVMAGAGGGDAKQPAAAAEAPAAPRPVVQGPYEADDAVGRLGGRAPGCLPALFGGRCPPARRLACMPVPPLSRATHSAPPTPTPRARCMRVQASMQALSGVKDVHFVYICTKNAPRAANGGGAGPGRDRAETGGNGAGDGPGSSNGADSGAAGSNGTSGSSGSSSDAAR
jgi:hypothetical protein